ncbi:hypothetical protein G9A89_011031 [Geosiphon pyriformis]|nr:hypothetical protein G9A89_011031 [Geosiphon pyriformis]
MSNFSLWKNSFRKNVLNLKIKNGIPNSQKRTAHDLIIRKTTGKPIIKYGPGGRSSVSGHIATVFGCTGFLGRYVVSKLAKKGTQVVIPYRDEDQKRPLKVMGDLGQIVPIEFDLRNRDAIISAVKHSDIVYNLIGRDYETKNFSFEAVHIDGAIEIAKAARDHGVSRLVHVSALNANENSSSKFYRTKAIGEKRVKEIFPDVTIVRPARIYGIEDRFLNRIAAGSGFEFLIRNGDSKMYPVNVLDVAHALEIMQKSESTIGETYELFGDKQYSYAQICDFVAYMTLKRVTRIFVPKSIAIMYARLVGFHPSAQISPDDIERMLIDDHLTPGLKTFKDLSIEPQSLEASSLRTLRLYRKNTRFELPLDELAGKKFKDSSPFFHTST